MAIVAVMLNSPRGGGGSANLEGARAQTVAGPAHVRPRFHRFWACAACTAALLAAGCTLHLHLYGRYELPEADGAKVVAATPAPSPAPDDLQTPDEILEELIR